MIGVGERAPEFSAPSTQGLVQLKDLLREGALVLYFFPRAMTPGCTAEATEFNELLPEFAALGTVVAGVSVDPLPRLERFREKHGLEFVLISDQERSIGRVYGTLKGANSSSHERDTVVISQTAEIVLTYRQVKARGHARKVLEDIRGLSEAGKL